MSRWFNASAMPRCEHCQLFGTFINLSKVIMFFCLQQDLSKIGIEGLVPAHTVMVIKITATTSVGKALSDDKLALVMRACAAVLELEEFKKRLYEYIASRMNVLAPNLCMLVGSEIAARLMALAGGLLPLSNIPASNLLVPFLFISTLTTIFDDINLSILLLNAITGVGTEEAICCRIFALSSGFHPSARRSGL
jgi:hypothetical protein